MHDANNAVRMKEIISFSVRVGLAKGPQPATLLSVVDAVVSFLTFVTQFVFALEANVVALARFYFSVLCIAGRKFILK